MKINQHKKQEKDAKTLVICSNYVICLRLPLQNQSAVQFEQFIDCLSLFSSSWQALSRVHNGSFVPCYSRREMTMFSVQTCVTIRVVNVNHAIIMNQCGHLRKFFLSLTINAS